MVNCYVRINRVHSLFQSPNQPANLFSLVDPQAPTIPLLGLSELCVLTIMSSKITLYRIPKATKTA